MNKVKPCFGVVSLALILILGCDYGRSQNEPSKSPNKKEAAASSKSGGESTPARGKTNNFVSDDVEAVPLTTLDAVKRSNRIVLAKSLFEEARKVAGGNIYTFSRFEVIQVVKGQFSKKEFELRILGGRVGDSEISSPLTLKFTPGRKFVLFLGQDNTDGYPTIIPQALFRVLGSASNGDEVVQPNPTGLPLFHAKDGSPYRENTEQLRLDDFLFSLGKGK